MIHRIRNNTTFVVALAYIGTFLLNRVYSPWDTVISGSLYGFFYNVEGVIQNFVLYGIVDLFRCIGMAFSMSENISIVSTIEYDSEEVYNFMTGIAMIIVTVVFLVGQMILVRRSQYLNKRSVKRIQSVIDTIMMNNVVGYIGALISYTSIAFVERHFPIEAIYNQKFFFSGGLRFCFYILSFIGIWAAIILMLSAGIFVIFATEPIIIANEIASHIGVYEERIIAMIATPLLLFSICVLWNLVQDKVMVFIWKLFIFPVTIYKMMQKDYTHESQKDPHI